MDDTNLQPVADSNTIEQKTSLDPTAQKNNSVLYLLLVLVLVLALGIVVWVFTNSMSGDVNVDTTGVTEQPADVFVEFEDDLNTLDAELENSATELEGDFNLDFAVE